MVTILHLFPDNGYISLHPEGERIVVFSIGNIKRAYRVLSALIVISVLASCATVPSVSLNAVEKDGAVVSMERGEGILTVSNDEMLLSVSGGGVDSGEAAFTIGVTNLSGKDITFTDSSIEIAYGNVDSDEWPLSTVWNATEYYQEVEREAKTARALTAVSGALNILSASLGSTTTSTVTSSSGYSYTINTHSYSPRDVAFATSAAIHDNMAVKAASEMTLDYLKSNLMFSSDLGKDESYGGLVIVDEEKAYPDFKVTLNTSSGPLTAYFERSDRDDIIHPWGDKKYTIYNSIVFGYGINSPFNLLWIQNAPKGVGVYTGIDFMKKKPDKDTYEYYDDPTVDGHTFSWFDFKAAGGKSVGTRVGFPLGMSIKVIPHTWLLLGLDYALESVYEEGYYEDGGLKSGTCWRESRITFDMGIEAGLSLVFNQLSIFVLYSLPILQQTYNGFSVGGGVAF